MTEEQKKRVRQVGVKARAIKQRGKKQVNGFTEFIRTQGVVGLGVGLALGGAVTVMVKSFIDNIIMPPIGLVLGSAEGLKGLSMTIGRTESGQGVVLHYGVFLNDLFNFLVIALVIYIVVHILGFDKLDRKKEGEGETKK